MKLHLAGAVLCCAAFSGLNAIEIEPLAAWNHSFSNNLPVSYTQPGGNGSPVIGYGEDDTYVNSDTVVSELTLGSGLTSLELFAPPSNTGLGGNWDIGGFTGTGGTGQYLEATIGPAAGKLLTIDQIAVLMIVGVPFGGSVPSSLTYDLYSSLDGFSAAAASATVPLDRFIANLGGSSFYGSLTPPLPRGVNDGVILSLGSPEFENISSPVTFRIVPRVSGGDVSGVLGMNRITIQALVPENSTFGLMTGMIALGAAFLGVRRRGAKH